MPGLLKMAAGLPMQKSYHSVELGVYDTLEESYAIYSQEKEKII